MDYEKKYKNALEWARMVMDGKIGFIRKDVEDVFPELAESEDERIRKELLDFCKNRAENYPNDPKYKNISAWITWLEKLGEEKPIWTDNDRIMTFTLLRDVDQMTTIDKEGKNERLEWLNSLEEKFNKE